MDIRTKFSQTFHLEIIIAAVVFGLVALVLAFALVRSRTRWGRRASHKSSHPRLEGVYVSIVAAVAAFLITVSLTENNFPTTPKPRLVVHVTGFQWCWRFSYAGTPVTVTADCVDAHTPTLVVPTGEQIRFDVTSADVIHAMWIPYLRFKVFAYPSHVNSFTTSFTQIGHYPARCAEFCGLYHYAMDFTLQTMRPAQFSSWLHSHEQARP